MPSLSTTRPPPPANAQRLFEGEPRRPLAWASGSEPDGGSGAVLRFLSSPLAIAGAGRVESMTIAHDRLERDQRGALRAVHTGEVEVLRATVVFRAIGYGGVALPGLPFDDSVNAIAPIAATGRSPNGCATGSRQGDRRPGRLPHRTDGYGCKTERTADLPPQGRFGQHRRARHERTPRAIDCRQRDACAARRPSAADPTHRDGALTSSGAIAWA